MNRVLIGEGGSHPMTPLVLDVTTAWSARIDEPQEGFGPEHLAVIQVSIGWKWTVDRPMGALNLV